MCFALFDVRIRVEPHHWWERIVDDKRDWMEAPTFKLKVGESCVIKSSYIEQMKNVERYKVMYTRSATDLYVWLDNKGEQGTIGNCSGVIGGSGMYVGTFHDTDFSTDHWEKLDS
jgi:hypothetical protein